jgi:hypothetical protein
MRERFKKHVTQASSKGLVAVPSARTGLMTHELERDVHVTGVKDALSCMPRSVRPKGLSRARMCSKQRCRRARYLNSEQAGARMSRQIVQLIIVSGSGWLLFHRHPRRCGPVKRRLETNSTLLV